MYPGDLELYKVHKAYFDWVERLWSSLVTSAANPERRFRLTVEGGNLDAFEGGSAAFITAVRLFIRHTDDDVFRAAVASERISRSMKLAAPGYLGILASCVFVAGNMASDDRFAASAYYPRFNNIILGNNSRESPKNFEHLRTKWVALTETVRQRQLGHLMTPKDPSRSPIRNLININYPLSQCLFRKVDLDNMSPQLGEWADNGLSGDQALLKLFMHAEQNYVSAALKHGMTAAQNDDGIREAYSEALDDILADAARLTRAAKSVRARKATATLDSAGTGRMRLVGKQHEGREIYDIIFEILVDGKWKVADDVRCEANDIVVNRLFIVEGRPYRYLGIDPQIFVQTDDFDIATQRGNKLASNAVFVAVTTLQHESEIVIFANGIIESDPSIRDSMEHLKLLDRFAELRAVRFRFTQQGARKSGLPACLSRFDVAPNSALRAVGGLKTDGGYLIGCPPRLEMMWDPIDGEPPTVYCDKFALQAHELSDRYEFDLSDYGDSRGTHYVSSADPRLHLTFAIVDPDPIVRLAPLNGSFNAVYFGPQFLKFPVGAKLLKMARNDAIKGCSDGILMQGPWFVGGHDAEHA